MSFVNGWLWKWTRVIRCLGVLNFILFLKIEENEFELENQRAIVQNQDIEIQNLKNGKALKKRTITCWTLNFSN